MAAETIQNATFRNPYPFGSNVDDVRQLIADISLDNLHGMPAAEWWKVYRPTIVNARSYKLRDTRIIGAGETVPQKVHGFFAAPIGQPETSLGGTIAIPSKTKRFTNIETAQRLEPGQVLIVDSVQAKMPVTSRDFAAFVAGEPTDLTPNTVTTNSSANTVIGLCRVTGLTVREGQEIIAEGRLDDFPSESVFNGGYGGDADEGITQIGNGFAKPLREIYVLRGGRLFHTDLEFYNAVISPQNVEIEISLCGFLLEDR